MTTFDGKVCLFLQLMFGLSIAGSLFDGYFFAFHLFNIVANNQLLKGVVRAVTQNGELARVSLVLNNIKLWCHTGNEMNRALGHLCAHIG